MIDIEVRLNKKITEDDLKSLVIEFGGVWSPPSKWHKGSEGSLGNGDILVLVSYDEEENSVIINIGGDRESGKVVADLFIERINEKWQISNP